MLSVVCIHSFFHRRSNCDSQLLMGRLMSTCIVIRTLDRLEQTQGPLWKGGNTIQGVTKYIIHNKATHTQTQGWCGAGAGWALQCQHLSLSMRSLLNVVMCVPQDPNIPYVPHSLTVLIVSQSYFVNPFVFYILFHWSVTEILRPHGWEGQTLLSRN